MANVELYTIQYCPYCASARQLLDRKGVTYTVHDLSNLPDEELHRTILQISGKRTVPQIVINGRSVGGYTDLRRLEETGELDRLLNEA